MGLRLSKSQYEKLIKSKNKKIRPKDNKYRNDKITVNGITYDSKKEYDRHRILKVMEKSGSISDLKFHDPSTNIILQENPKIKYEPDFCYFENGVYIIEDVKGYQTKEFKLKKKMIIHKLNNNEIIGKFRLTKYSKDKGFVVIEEYKSKDL